MDIQTKLESVLLAQTSTIRRTLIVYAYWRAPFSFIRFLLTSLAFLLVELWLWIWGAFVHNYTYTHILSQVGKTRTRTLNNSKRNTDTLDLTLIPAYSFCRSPTSQPVSSILRWLLLLLLFLLLLLPFIVSLVTIYRFYASYKLHFSWLNELRFRNFEAQQRTQTPTIHACSVCLIACMRVCMCVCVCVCSMTKRWVQHQFYTYSE